MDRIEDESVRYLYFLQIEEGNRSLLPFDPDTEDNGEVAADEYEDDAPPVADVTLEQRRSAQSSIEDFTRNIAKKKEKEMEALQFAGGEASPQQQPTLAKKTPGRNDACWCGSGKKYKKCHGV